MTDFGLVWMKISCYMKPQLRLFKKCYGDRLKIRLDFEYFHSLSVVGTQLGTLQRPVSSFPRAPWECSQGALRRESRLGVWRIRDAARGNEKALVPKLQLGNSV